MGPTMVVVSFMSSLKYLSSYPQHLQDQIQTLIDEQRLDKYLLGKYPSCHDFKNDGALRDYTLAIKNRYLKKSSPLSKVVYDGKIHVINNALGLHKYINRVQGSKTKSKNEIHIASMFKNGPEEFLNMIVVHELAHLRERDHNKAFYKLCQHMQPDYHQLEFDMRVYLTQLEIGEDIYK